MPWMLQSEIAKNAIAPPKSAVLPTNWLMQPSRPSAQAAPVVSSSIVENCTNAQPPYE